MSLYKQMQFLQINMSEADSDYVSDIKISPSNYESNQLQVNNNVESFINHRFFLKFYLHKFLFYFRKRLF